MTMVEEFGNNDMDVKNP